MYRHLKDAVLELDPVLIRTMSGFSVEVATEGYRVRFKFAFYGPNLDELADESTSGSKPSTVSQYPDIEVMLRHDARPREQVDELSESGLLGELYAVQIPPNVQGNSTDAPKWIVRTHAGSQAEHIEWLRSIG